uniref:Beta-sarcoglycan n=2 Tax=Hirondellea gigas TaxID=1518452 RepID=A0A6A7G045_9CRUS
MISDGVLGSSEVEDGDGITTTMPVMTDEGLVANSSLERATLTRRTARRLQTQYSNALAPGKSMSGGSGVFWTMVFVLLLLALCNLALTFFAMGVLRLGIGMESIEFITEPQPMLKLFGLADLGLVQQKDGILTTYAGESLSITGDNSQVSIGVNTVRPSPALHISQHSVRVVNVNKFQVLEPETGRTVFSTDHPSFAVPRGVKNLHVQRTQTPRIVSPTYADLAIRADSTIRVKGNEGVSMSGRTLEWNADQDIYLRSFNGSLILDGGSGGIFVEVNNLPLAGQEVDHSWDRGQYKLCVCHKSVSSGKGGDFSSRDGSDFSNTGGGRGSANTAREIPPNTLEEGRLFRVPVPLDNMRRSKQHQINCASFTNPCMTM